MSYTEGLSGLHQQINNGLTQPKNTSKRDTIGRVYAIILDETNLSKEIFQKYGGWDSLGTIFYLDYSRRENIPPSEIVERINKNYFQVAKPVNFDSKFFPLVGELVNINELPTPLLQNNSEVNIQYYDKVVNYFGTFKGAQSFEGDNIIGSRFGSNMRFSSTAKLAKNWWNNGIKDGDPITIISNGFEASDKPHVEDINTDGATFVLTSTQTVPISAVKNKLNPLTQPIALEHYQNPQAFTCADRVVLVAKKDEVILASNRNVEIAAKDIINLDAENRVTLNAPYVILGLDGNKLPTQPALLGENTFKLLLSLLQNLSEFSSALTTAVSTPQGSPIVTVTTAASMLQSNLTNLIKNITNILSSKVYIAK